MLEFYLMCQTQTNKTKWGIGQHRHPGIWQQIPWQQTKKHSMHALSPERRTIDAR